MLARLLRGVRDGSAQALELLTDRGKTSASGPEARGEAAGIVRAQIAMIDAVLPLGAISYPSQSAASAKSEQPDKLTSAPASCKPTSAPA